MDPKEPKTTRSKGKNKAKNTFNKYGKNTQKGARAKERLTEILADKGKKSDNK